jgi:hypothetical protein
MAAACSSDATVGAVKLSRILACGLALIGAYFFVLRVAWLIELDDEWVPYAAHALAAMIAGAVIVRQGRGARLEPVVGAIVGIAILGVVSATSPRTFGWVALRSGAPWLVALAIAAGSVLLAELGARLSRRDDAGGGVGATMILSTAVAFCMVYLGGRILFTLIGSGETAAMLFAIVCVQSVFSGFVVQWVVPRARIVACASGIAILVLWQTVELVRSPVGRSMNGELLYLLIPIAAALLGSYTAAQMKPRAGVDTALDAFD